MTSLSDSPDTLTGATPARCLNCGADFDAMTLGGRRISACCCDECLEAWRLKLCPPEAPKHKETRNAWMLRCPPRYAHFEAAKLPSRGKAVLAKVLAWTPTNARGIGLVGPSDGGKSMLMHELARLTWEGGHDVHVTSSTEFAYRVSSGDNEERRKAIDRCMNCEILFLDDIGKEKMTERVESDIYHILEHREKWLKTTCFTANSKGAVLQERMSEDRAAPIVNRLRRLAEIEPV